MIFVVDDDAAVRDSLALLLEAHGMTVAAFESTEAFAAGYRPHDRECLILDQHLLGMKTGLDFLTSEQRSTIRLPVILVTGRGDTELKARALEAGASAYLDKPIEADRLIAEIDKALAEND